MKNEHGQEVDKFGRAIDTGAPTAVVTGSAGFIGSYVVRELENLGYAVTRVERSTGGIRAWVPQGKYHDVAVHCAAYLGGREAIESRLKHTANIEADCQIIRWAEREQPGRFIYFSSVAAYPAYLQQHAGRLLHEDDIDFTMPFAGIPDKLYGWGKLLGEYMTSQLSCSWTIVRPFTVYGSEQDEVYPFRNMLAQAVKGDGPINIWGSGTQERDFIHVSDVAGAVGAIVRCGIEGPVNVCTGSSMTLHDLAVAIGTAARKKRVDVCLLRNKPEGLPYRLGDPTRLEEFYVPKLNIQDGIDRCVREVTGA